MQKEILFHLCAENDAAIDVTGNTSRGKNPLINKLFSKKQQHRADEKKFVRKRIATMAKF